MPELLCFLLLDSALYMHYFVFWTQPSLVPLVLLEMRWKRNRRGSCCVFMLLLLIINYPAGWKYAFFPSPQLFMSLVWDLYTVFHKSILSRPVSYVPRDHTQSYSRYINTSFLLLSPIHCLQVIPQFGLPSCCFSQLPLCYYMIMRTRCIRLSVHSRVRAIKL